MMRFIMPVILIGISITVFFLFANPIYKDIGALRTQAGSYNEALGNNKSFQNQRDVLTRQQGAIDPVNLVKLQKLLPENVDNIRLILEIEKIAGLYGMILKDVKYNTASADAAKTSAPGAVAIPQGGGIGLVALKDYGVWDLEFSTSGSYSNFLSFIKKLESNLRIVDISSIQFSSSQATISGATLQETYKYSFKIKTYWLKK